MALAREPRDTSQTLLAAHNSILSLQAVATINTTTNALAYSRPSTAATSSSITQAIAAANENSHSNNNNNGHNNRSARRASYSHNNNNSNNIPVTSNSSGVAPQPPNSLPPYPQPPFILGHAYATEWRSARQIEAARFKLFPKNLVKDKAGPMSYPLSTDGFEQLSTTKSRPFGGQVDGHYANFATDVANATGRASTNNNPSNADGTTVGNPASASTLHNQQQQQLMKNIRGTCTFGNTPRMVSGDIHNEKSKSSGHRPASASNRLKSPRSQLSEIEKKYGPLRLGMTDGTSLPGASYRKVFVTPAACEYDVKRATSLTKERSPRCSFGTCARFDGGSEASGMCKPSALPSTPRSARGSNNNKKENNNPLSSL